MWCFIDSIKNKIDALDSVSDISVLPPKKGNVYTFDGPENNELLDWEAHITKQPEAVRTARKEILQQLKKAGLDNSEAKKAKNGEEFYRALQNILADSKAYTIAEAMIEMINAGG